MPDLVLSTRSPGPGPRAAWTERRYARDWAAFRGWCQATGQASLPAAGASVDAYLRSLGTLSPGALARRLSAINGQHRARGLPEPGADPRVRSTLRAARRAATPRRKPRPSPAILRRAARACPSDLTGLRDRALLLLLADGSLDRATIVQLTVETARVTLVAIEVTVSQRGGHQNRTVAIARHDDARLCPVHAFRDWLDSAGITFDAAFPKIDRWGNLQSRALGPDAIRRILARRVKARASTTGKRKGDHG